MYCEACNRARGETGSDPIPDSAEFQATLQRGMHAMAQPMTLLRSYFYLAQGGVPVSRQLLDDATSGMEQLCGTFRLMQEFVAMQTMAARLEDVTLASVLAQLSDDAEAVLAGIGLALDVEFEPLPRPSHKAPDHQEPHREEPHHEAPLAILADRSAPRAASLTLMRIDPSRTRQALLSMLHIMRHCSQDASVIRCRLSSADGWLAMVLEPENSVDGVEEDCLDEVARLHLALARANALSQQAGLEVRTHPFALILRLPVNSPLARPSA